MNAADLVTYSAATDYIFLVVAAVGFIGLLVYLSKAFGPPDPMQGRYTMNLTAVTVIVMLVAAGAGAVWFPKQTEMAAADAKTVNAKVLKTWAEPAYGITVTDEQAEQVMAAWASNEARRGRAYAEQLFWAETPDGKVRMELAETDNGSFELLKNEPMKPADEPQTGTTDG
ncbi:hypothetical protein [Arthrobacter sp. IK3]|uniref:hypothetical protein n=1 Tax=Arthrobacter sp. IK3 TaxID=3448169 RepID=UPI003EE371A2